MVDAPWTADARWTADDRRNAALRWPAGSEMQQLQLLAPPAADRWSLWGVRRGHWPCCRALSGALHPSNVGRPVRYLAAPESGPVFLGPHVWHVEWCADLHLDHQHAIRHQTTRFSKALVFRAGPSTCGSCRACRSGRQYQQDGGHDQILPATVQTEVLARADAMSSVIRLVECCWNRPSTKRRCHHALRAASTRPSDPDPSAAPLPYRLGPHRMQQQCLGTLSFLASLPAVEIHLLHCPAAAPDRVLVAHPPLVPGLCAHQTSCAFARTSNRSAVPAVQLPPELERAAQPAQNERCSPWAACDRSMSSDALLVDGLAATAPMARRPSDRANA
jgi:hypothetical protein